MFYTLPGSMSSAPQFEITLGLKEGYGTNAKMHAVSEVVAAIKKYQKKQAAAEKPYLTGSVRTGTLVYAWFDKLHGQAFADHEEQVIFVGNKNPLYHQDLLESQMRDLVSDLADELGNVLGQTRVYVAYSGDMWIRQAEGNETPTGETVKEVE